jgi:hypothetical protein
VISQVSPGELAQRHAWRGALVAAALNTVAMPVDSLLGRAVPGLPLWPNLLSAGIGVLLVVGLILRRRTTTVPQAAILFLVNTGATLLALWVTSAAWAGAGPRWIPFQANKLGALAASLLAPELGSGLGAIGAYVAMVPLRCLTFTPAVWRNFAAGEPWTIFIYGLFGVALLVYRLQGQALERRMLRLYSEAAATERLARTFLAVRDFTNTPLQTIELATEVIRQTNPELGPALDRIDRSVDRLFRLNHTFSAYESHLKWTKDEVSMDTEAMVGRV